MLTLITRDQRNLEQYEPNAKMVSFRKPSRSERGVSGVMTVYGFVATERLNLVMDDATLSD